VDEPGCLPLGQQVWGDSWLELPAECLADRWTNMLTEETVDTQALGEGNGLALAQVFASFPYALLWACKPAEG
jgi:(1->4)-alpha-D-glucan 1-alpha-D-glucosylmutase